MVRLLRRSQLSSHHLPEKSPSPRRNTVRNHQRKTPQSCMWFNRNGCTKKNCRFEHKCSDCGAYSHGAQDYPSSAGTQVSWTSSSGETDTQRISASPPMLNCTWRKEPNDISAVCIGFNRNGCNWTGCQREHKSTVCDSIENA